ncbi:MAG: hypothetical protein WCJ59_01990 [bacterium]
MTKRQKVLLLAVEEKTPKLGKVPEMGMSPFHSQVRKTDKKRRQGNEKDANVSDGRTSVRGRGTGIRMRFH